MGELYVANENAFVAAAECYRLAACALQIRASGIVYLQSQIANLQSKTNSQGGGIGRRARLGLRNHRFQSVASRFKTKLLHDRKMVDFGEILQSTNTEQKTCHSSTNSSTRTHQSHARVRLTIDVRAMFVLPSNALHCGLRGRRRAVAGYSPAHWMKGKKTGRTEQCAPVDAVPRAT